MRIILFIILLAVLPSAFIQAQIVESAPVFNPTLKSHAYKASLSNVLFKNPTDTLNLPFMDDFSYEGPHPSSNNWASGNSVFINNTLAIQPPSVGVATFDGLDQSGSPYGSSGSSDTLSSCPFFLGNYSPLDDVYLSFHYQPKGEGDRPELTDSLVLEFKDINDNWANTASWPGIEPGLPESFTPDFAFYSIAVDEAYLYDGFQFRLRNKSSGKGQIDLWHVDYIRLTASIIPTENSSDVAFTEAPNTFLSSYESMPWRQFTGFEDMEATSEYQLTLFNHFPDIQEIQNRIVTIKELTNNIEVLNTNFLTDASAPIPLGNVDPGVHIEATKQIDAANYSTFINNLQSQFIGAEDLVFETSFDYTQSGQNPAFQATIDNDHITRKTIFSNYFAYDDGTAESNVKAQNIGTDIAVKFTMNVADSLKAFQMHIPHISVDASLQLFNLKVYLDLNADPVYEANFQSPIYVDEIEEADTLQGFTTYILKDNLGNPAPLYIPAGDFYMSWEQGSDTDNPIPVGFDKNNPAAGVNNYYNGGGGWEAFPSTLQGAILLRPVVGNAIVYTTSTENLNAETFFNIYPNPANEVLVFSTLNGEDFDGGIEIFDVTGKKIKTSEFQEFIPVIDLPNGVYFIQLTEWETSIRYNKKVVIQH